MARRIARLSRPQIEEAIAFGGWPLALRPLLAEKLISRRNDLVSAFELEAEFPLLAFDRNVSSADGAVRDGQLRRGTFSEHTQNYGQELLQILRPVYQTLEMLAVKALQGVAASFDKITVTGDQVGIERNIVGEVEITFGRDITPNQWQTGDDDKFLVEDTMYVRFGLGLGLVARGKVSYLKTYKLIYPVKDRRTGMYHDRFILNLLLPTTSVATPSPPTTCSSSRTRSRRRASSSSTRRGPSSGPPSPSSSAS